jgi:hypothetical protein
VQYIGGFVVGFFWGYVSLVWREAAPCGEGGDCLTVAFRLEGGLLSFASPKESQGGLKSEVQHSLITESAEQ